MMLRALAAILVLAPSSALAGPDPACGPHEHLVVEKDADEGSTVKRCLCDEGWDEGGPAPPCRQAKKAPEKKKRK
jgi:hypothetical protein